MDKRILILGAGVYQVPLIVAARRRGLKAVVASRPGPYPGINLADTFLPIDITDRPALLAAACEHQVQAVATTGADAGLPALGGIVDALGLPGVGLDSAERSTDKIRMKASFLQVDVPSARYGVFQAATEALEFANEIGYPVMVKPPDSSGSRGVIRVDRDEDFPAAWQEAMSHAGNGLVIVERCLIGREFGAQAVVQGEQVTAVFIHDDTVTPAPLSTPVGHAMPAKLPAAVVTRTEKVIANAVAALGLRDCVANVDLILVADEPHVIEIGGRMGATGIPEMLNVHNGWDIYDLILDLALGLAHPLPRATGVPNAVTLLRSERTGIVLSLEVPAEIRNHPDLVAVQWDVAPGESVRAFRVGPDRVGQLQVTGVSSASAAALAEALRKGTTIEVKESS